MATSVQDATTADMAALATLREGLAAHFGDAVRLTATETAACPSASLLEAALERFAARGPTELSVKTVPDNDGALRL
jgi:hypothetical protein